MNLKIDKVVYPGRSLGFDEGKVVFTDRGLPGETVEVEVFRDRKNFFEARTVRIVEKAFGRVEPKCGHYLACSPYQDMEYPLQLEVKRGQVEEIFRHGLKREWEGWGITPSPEIWGYRNRIRLRVLRREGAPRLGYHEPGEPESFLAVDRCFLVSDRTNALIGEIEGFVGTPEAASVEEVEVRESRSRGRLLLVLHLGPGAMIEPLAERLSDLHERHPLSGIVAVTEDGRNIRETTLGGVPRIEESVRGLAYKIGPRSFFQVNIGILETVFGDVERAAGANAEGAVADLYCGLGTFGILMARGGAREVFGVEPDPANISFLKKNLARNGVGNFTVCEGTSEDWLPWILEKEPEVVILDPPRRGVDRRALEFLAGRPVPVLLYLSCNPTTLVRDLEVLLTAYDFDDLKIYDFFPHTPHIETLAVLKGKSGVI